MYQVLSFQLPAQPRVTNEEAIRALVRWVSRSQHYDFEEADLEEMLSCRQVVRAYDDILGKRAALRFCRTTVDGAHYIEMRIDNPDEANNFLWRAECIFCRREDAQAGTFQVTLSRAPMQEGESICLDTVAHIPYIAKQLKRDGHLALSAPSGAGFWSKPLDRFPMIICGGSYAGCEEDLIKQLKNRLGPIAQVVSEEQVALYLEKTEGLEQDSILVVYPIARVRKTYSHVILPNSTKICKEKVDQVISDVIRWVTEIHTKTVILWQEVSETAVPAPIQGSYCTINRSMGNCLRALRRKNGLSQQELASKIGTTGLIISRLETVRVQRVSRNLLKEIELALGVKEGTISAAQEDSGLKESAPDSEDGQQVPEKDGFCRHCGLHLYRDSSFCPKCGTKVLR